MTSVLSFRTSEPCSVLSSSPISINYSVNHSPSNSVSSSLSVASHSYTSALPQLGMAQSENIGCVQLPLPLPGAKAESQAKQKHAKCVDAGSFEASQHFYPRALNAQIHPLVASFMQLGNERIASRYCHLHPRTSKRDLLNILESRTSHFRWAGCDLFNVTTPEGGRRMIVVETNSCPSGQKSMPLVDESCEGAGYRKLMESTFSEILNEADPFIGGLAVVYDKNVMEASGYAAAMADISQENVFLVEYYHDDIDPPVRWVDGVMHVRDQQREWHPIRVAFKYVTQRPWNRFPVKSKTIILNNIVSCLAGGRNKAVAAVAYDEFNKQMEATNLSIRVPETIVDVPLDKVPSLVERMGWHAVLKVPYSNAGQGVYTITNQQELLDFLAENHRYDKFIVQSLVGNSSWSSNTTTGKFYHAGTIPDRKNRTYASDLRIMVCSTKHGFRPLALYARRAKDPLIEDLTVNPENYSSWDMLGTNLSVKEKENTWTTDTSRLLLMDRKDFNTLGLGLDDLIDGYVQTVMATIAIDNMCHQLIQPSGEFDVERFRQVNPDEALIREIRLV